MQAVSCITWMSRPWRWQSTRAWNMQQGTRTMLVLYYMEAVNDT